MKNDTVKTEYVYVIYGRMCDTCFTPDICITLEDALKLRREQIVEYCEINELNLPDDIDSSETTITVEGKYAYAEWNIEPVKFTNECCRIRLNRRNLVITDIYNHNREINGKQMDTYEFYMQTWFDVDKFFGTSITGTNNWFYFNGLYIPKLARWEFNYNISGPGLNETFDFTDRITAEDRQLIIDMVCEKLWFELEDVPFTESDNDMVLDTDCWAFWKSGASKTEIWKWLDRNYSRNLPGLIIVCDRLSTRSGL